MERRGAPRVPHSECSEHAQEDKVLRGWAPLLQLPPSFTSVSAPTSAIVYQQVKGKRKGWFLTPSTFKVASHYLPPHTSLGMSCK